MFESGPAVRATPSLGGCGLPLRGLYARALGLRVSLRREAYRLHAICHRLLERRLDRRDGKGLKSAADRRAWSNLSSAA